MSEYTKQAITSDASDNTVNNEELEKMYFETFTGTPAVDTNPKWILFQRAINARKTHDKHTRAFCLNQKHNMRGKV